MDRIRLDGGVNTQADKRDLREGQLQQAIGAYYRQEDSRLWKQRGRAVFGSMTTPARVKGLLVCKFDGGVGDTVLALGNNSLFGADLGEGGESNAMTDLLGRSPLSGHLSGVHALNRWYITTGEERNTVLESDGTLRPMSMLAPQLPPIAVVGSHSGTPGTENIPSTALDNVGFFGTEKAYDNNLNTFAVGPVSPSAPNASCTWGGFASGPAQVYNVVVDYRLAGVQIIPGDDNDVGHESGYVVDVRLFVSGDSGINFTQLSSFRASSSTSWRTFNFRTAGSGNPITLQFKAEIDLVSGALPASLQIARIRAIGTDGPAVEFDATGVQYAYTEYDEDRDRESPPSTLSDALELVAASNDNKVTLTLPETPTNSLATHYRIYRLPTTGVAPGDLGRVSQIQVSATFQDNFDKPHDQSLFPTIPMVSVEGLLFPRDSPAPQFDYLSTLQGGLIGSKGRGLFSAIPGRPESWPEVNIIAGFELSERDEIVAHGEVSERSVVCLTETVLILDSLPRVEDGRLVVTRPRPLSGSPGIVGPRAFCRPTIRGESLGAWVSQWGIYMTNTELFYRVTDDIDWLDKFKGIDLSNSVLAWSESRKLMIFAYDSDGDGENDKYAFIHLVEDSDIRKPRITWDHPGRIASLAIAKDGGFERCYSGHESDGKVYLEDTGLVDASNAYDDSGTVPLIVRTPVRVKDFTDSDIFKGNLYHTAAGKGQSAAVVIRAGWDDSDPDETDVQEVEEVVSLEGHRGSEFFVGLSGEWYELTITHFGAAEFALGDIGLIEEPSGMRGRGFGQSVAR